MASPNAKAMPSTSTAVGPLPMPAITAAPHPNKTSVNVPINSATDFFIAASPSRDYRRRQSRRRCYRLGLAAGGTNVDQLKSESIAQEVYARRSVGATNQAISH